MEVGSEVEGEGVRAGAVEKLWWGWAGVDNGLGMG